MSLKTNIEHIFLENTDYANPSQAVNQASSLNALSADLYTDSRRFIYELLQNADDSSLDNTTVKVWIKVFQDNLVIAHSGEPFTPRDLQGICNVNNGTKKSDPTKTGYKGIGFKSVFGQSDKVTIFSNAEYFRFDSSFQFVWKWETSKADWEQNNDRKFQFPWQIIPIYTKVHEVSEPIDQFLKSIKANVATIIKLKNTKETSIAIEDLSQNINMFLFLKNISEINFEVTEQITVEIKRKDSDKITLKNSKDSKTEWLINTVSLIVPEDVKTVLKEERNIPDKLLNANSIELTLAAKVGIEGIIILTSQERLLYSYLPTDETKYSFPVLVNASFLTSANRETLHSDSKWNQWLFKNIAIEIFKWISKLVKTEIKFQAYQLIPKETINDELGKKFNEGIKDALKNIPFVMSKDDSLEKIEDTIVDFTFLSEKYFVGDEPIKKFIDNYETTGIISSKKFAKKTGFGSDFKKLGAKCFDWKDLPAFLNSTNFTNTHTLTNNIQLIQCFKNLCDSENVRDISKEILLNFPFIWDHKNSIKRPNQVCFPAADDQSWNNPKSDLSFLHQELQNWLLGDTEMRAWLETLGMTEKTDITYITQTIIPYIDSYVTLENAIQTIQDLFNLYKKGDLNEKLIKQLSEINLLTQQDSLLPAKECFLSNFYNPRLKIEEILELDIYVNKSYCVKITEKDEWKRFLKIMGVNEGISSISYEKTRKHDLTQKHLFKIEYFEEKDKYFQPFLTKFNADEYLNLKTLTFLLYTSEITFAKLFWNDIITNLDLDDLDSSAIAFWGNSGHPGRSSGDEVANYLKWFVKNNECIPTSMGICQKANNIFINTEDIVKLSGNYLSVFSGGDLSQNWKAFFNFKTNLQLVDYLKILKNIVSDINEKGKAKKDNYQRIQSIYSELLDKCTNWSSDDISEVEEWAKTGYLLNTKKKFTECTTLNYFIDGNESIFQDQFYFIELSAENKRHPNIAKLLNLFKVKILNQSDFELVHSRKEECLTLKDHLKTIIPYFKIWINEDTTDDNTREYLENIQVQIEKLKIYQAEELKIKYADYNFVKSVNVHFNERILFVTSPWNSNNVLLKLPEVLCRYFYLLGHDKKLDFLLRSTVEEVREYFAQEGIIIPEDLQNTDSKIEPQNLSVQMPIQSFNSFTDFETAYSEGSISSEFFHVSRSEFENLKRAESLISRSVSNIIEHLNKLSEYDCKNYYEIARSIIGGITKNGNDITVVARPSDGDKVLLFYTSEFDVLEYVDAEFWCEDGLNTPKQITLGLLLKQTGINRIPIINIDISKSDIETLLNTPKSEKFDFEAVPFVPQKIAKIISSYANTNGGTLIFGLKENNPTSNDIVGLSPDFRVVDITKRAISLLSPIPTVTYDWLTSGEKSIFVIKTEKADQDILFESQKYIRREADSVLEEKASERHTTLNVTGFRKTVAIIIAIEDYAPRDENQITKVKYANNDALRFKETLINSMNVDENDILMFVNDKALKSSLEYDLYGLFNLLTDEDRLIFYYVGHGFHNGITNYLSTYDMHKHHISETAVSLRKVLLDPLRKSKCKNALIFIDACAQSFQDEYERSQISDVNVEELIILNNEFPYYATFLSCQPGQSSYSSDVLNNGIWTHHLVKAISGQVPEVIYNNKYITDTLLKDYLSNSVAIYTKEELGNDQNPKAILDSSCENVIVILGEKIKN